MYPASIFEVCKQVSVLTKEHKTAVVNFTVAEVTGDLSKQFHDIKPYFITANNAAISIELILEVVLKNLFSKYNIILLVVEILSACNESGRKPTMVMIGVFVVFRCNAAMIEDNVAV
ncbi:uncharacterized protein B0P05DRAFT_339902 [Gilbertella persicaria]|uniref:uncharacterized protein n=1 Tax=Gilbertella persicaria TaxID=101096 RepID=UPI00221E37FC|nr:uncharacterized protein B0P05DRAFT_339902 [Gilbertella persicaria]KAI8048603.1 hypothetical protein B0P05DRAFT_339902 [Gilbertella persicaria]